MEALPIKATLNHLDNPALEDEPPVGSDASSTQISSFREWRVIDYE
jgi:hypothetical protein